MKSAVVCLHRRFRSTYCDAIGLNVAVLLLSFNAQFLQSYSEYLLAMEICFHILHITWINRYWSIFCLII